MARIKVKEEAPSQSLNFLYHTFLGRLILSVLVRPNISRLIGWFLNTRLSYLLITQFIKKNHIDMSDYPNVRYKSFNDFFKRRIRVSARPIDQQDDHFISPCDAKLSIYKIDEHALFYIKGSPYSVSSLLKNDILAKKYQDGYCLIFRLSVDDYHRYCYIDDGRKSKNIFISGVLHTVQPVAIEKVNIYKENSREYTVCYTKHFDEVIYVEVGAMLVGKISNRHQAYQFIRGEEKGHFEFGGSTIVLLVKKDQVQFDEEIIQNTNDGFETKVRLGERIGNKKTLL